ncbi:MAG: NAD(P)/FAD-dependent oxidoreductase [Treponemataceae bacterium]|nr:NAD(P)/FAD-dependent oxidoreductase [Treponemataceae bacterium]
MSKRVVVVGAGIAGLSAAIYAQRAGFDVTVLEKHVIPGGLCTSWTRKGYTFEGGMHWLTGSSEKLALNQIWKEVGALRKNNPIFIKDPFYTLVNGGKTLHLYRDADRLRAHFLEHAPEDAAAIRRLHRDICLFRGVHMIVSDIPFLKTRKAFRPSVSECLGMAPALLRLGALTNMTYADYVGMFKNSDIRHLLMAVNGTRYNALSLVYTLASFSTGDCGYPEGGSLRLTQNMTERLAELGGTLLLRQNVEKIIIENGKASGVTAGGKLYPADAVIVTQDTRQAIDTLFGAPFSERWASKMRKNVVSEQTMFVALGVKADLHDMPRAVILPLEKPFSAGGLEFGELRVNNYASYKGCAPEGSSCVTCLLLGDSWNFWKAAKEDGSYAAKKAELAERFTAVLSEYIPQVKGAVEVSDVATPLTYSRYCGVFEGGWMSVMGPGGKPYTYPSKSKTVRGLYFASQRTIVPGGLPIAVAAGRRAAQYVCRDNKVIF